MPGSKLSQDVLCEVLSFCTRIELEYLSIISHLLNRFIVKNYQSKPYLVVDSLIIRTDNGEKSYYLEDNGRQCHPRFRHFSDDNECSPNYRIYCTFVKMRPYLGQNVRVKRTSLRVKRKTVLTPTFVAEMKSLSHLWRDQTFSITCGSDTHLSDVLFQQIQPILSFQKLSQFLELQLSDINLSLRDYPVLYSLKVLKLCDCNSTNCVNILQFLEAPIVKPLIVYYAAINFSALINIIFQAFSHATSPSAFKIVLMRDNDCFVPVIEFQETNNISGEVLKLEQGIPEEYKDKYLGSFDYYTLQRYRI